MSTEFNTKPNVDSIAMQNLRRRMQSIASESPEQDRLPAVLAALKQTPPTLTHTPRASIRLRAWAGLGLAAASLALMVVWNLPKVPFSEQPQAEPVLIDSELQALMQRSQQAEAEFFAARQNSRISVREWESQQLATLALQELDQQLERNAMEMRSRPDDSAARSLWQARVQTLEDANQGRLNARVRYVD